METDERKQQIADLREVLNWFEKHPEIPLPVTEFNIYSWDTTEEARTMATAMGTFEKRAQENLFYLTKRFGTVQVRAVFSRSQVCKRIVTGKRTVPERVEVVPAHEEEIVEWDCPSLLKEESRAPEREVTV